MQIDLTPPVTIEAIEVRQERDNKSIECEQAYNTILGDKVNKIRESYTNHPRWGAIYRVQYSIPDTEDTESFICWFTDDGMAISLGR